MKKSEEAHFDKLPKWTKPEFDKRSFIIYMVIIAVGVAVAIVIIRWLT
jgi:hypothetical protein